MDKIMAPARKKGGVFAYIDEVIFFGKTFEEFSKDGVHTDPEKIAAIAEKQPPMTERQLRSFLGLANHYRQFILGYAQKTSKMYELLRWPLERDDDKGPHEELDQVTNFENYKYEIPARVIKHGGHTGHHVPAPKPDEPDPVVPPCPEKVTDRTVQELRRMQHRDPTLAKKIHELEHQTEMDKRSKLPEHYQINKAAKLRYYWDRMNSDIHDYINRCQTCIFSKVPRRATYGKLQPTDAVAPWYRVFADFKGPLPVTETKKYRYVAVVVDQMTKFTIARPTKTNSAKEFEKLSVEEVVLKYGMPHTVHSERGTHFTAKSSPKWRKFLASSKRSDLPITPRAKAKSNARCKRSVMEFETLAAR
ncbi:uncharacterized protein K02A2.6-like [Paramacrobiotus metropolitanus]|uniref:uncharacterized protein K02A2.6-like n=1 Tax=Paramacrobiotus metropolitanus TaxID=2943436 RepID=UPI002445DEC0|nr:uncharacterized protein K02A2.6-like [Paramacrobiotus metropolitanus]